MTGTCNNLWLVTSQINNAAYYLVDDTDIVIWHFYPFAHYRVGEQIPVYEFNFIYRRQPYISFKQQLKELL